jgi:hypothetical protein
MIDGKGQDCETDGYGRVTRYLHGRQITYCTGDATNAYGVAGLTKFRRRVVFLRPNIVIVYDDLETDHAAEWSWLLHSPGKIAATSDEQFFTSTDNAQPQIDFFTSAAVTGNQCRSASQ